MFYPSQLLIPCNHISRCITLYSSLIAGFDETESAYSVYNVNKVQDVWTHLHYVCPWKHLQVTLCIMYRLTPGSEAVSPKLFTLTPGAEPERLG